MKTLSQLKAYAYGVMAWADLRNEYNPTDSDEHENWLVNINPYKDGDIRQMDSWYEGFFAARDYEQQSDSELMH